VRLFYLVAGDIVGRVFVAGRAILVFRDVLAKKAP